MNEEKLEQAFALYWKYKSEDNPPSAMWVKGVRELCQYFFKEGAGYGLTKRVVSDKTTSLEVRAEKFCRSLNTTENVQRYGMPMLKAFYDYWSEPNPSRTKMRFELQKTWDINRRLARWARNNFNVNRNGNKPDTNQQRVSKLADILVG